MIPDFEKIRSPFVRTGDPYIVTPVIAEGMDWVFGSCVKAVDKIDGTNVGIRIESGKVVEVYNRTTPWRLLHVRQTKNEANCASGIAAAIARGWLAELSDGIHYGELIGPSINGNRHGINQPLWVPFSYLSKKCFWVSWSENKYPKTFESISEWFKEIPSLFNSRMNLPSLMAEGLVVIHEDGRLAKLRRDMFDWYQGPMHAEEK